MNKTVDIDALLAADKLTLTLGGKIYEVDDVNLSVFMMTPKDDSKGDILHEQLAAILKVKKNDLKDVGIRAVAYALKEIRTWVTATGFEEEASSANP
jgi:hypothetical protein